MPPAGQKRVGRSGAPTHFFFAALRAAGRSVGRPDPTFSSPRCARRVGQLGAYMYDTYPPYLDQGLIQTVSTVSGPRYSRYGMYCISLYLDRGLIQLIQYVSDCIHTVSYM